MEVKFVSLGNAEVMPYSDITEVNDKMMFLSGMVSENIETGEVLHGTITEETRVTFENMKKLLEANGSDMEHVVKVDVLLHDFAERDEMNIEYKKHFKAGKRPARVCYGGVDLADGLKIEVTAIALKK